MAVTTTPTYPVAGEQITLAITGATGSTDATQFELTAVPDESELETGVLVDPADDPVQYFTPDVQGAYTVAAYDHRRYAGAAANYPGAPVGDARDELVAKQTGTIYVAASLDLPIVTTLGHSATLRLRVHNNTVRAAEIVDPTTEVARLAALQSAVTSALTAMVGIAASPGTLGENFVDDVNALASAFENHRVQVGGTSIHASADTTNVLRTERATSIPGAIDRLYDIADHYSGHVMAGSAGGTWHGTDDGLNLPIAARGPSLASAVVFLADLRERGHEAHRSTTGSPAVHGGADGTASSIMAAPLPQTAAIVAYLTAIATLDPTAPTGEQEGVANLSSGFGYVIVP